MNLNFEIGKNAIAIDLDRHLIVINGMVSAQYLDAIIRALTAIDKDQKWEVTWAGLRNYEIWPKVTWNTSTSTDE